VRCDKWRKLVPEGAAWKGAWYCELNPDRTHSSYSALQDPRAGALRNDVGYKVEALLAKRQRGQARQFLVRWLGFDASYDTWEGEANILDPSLVSRFLTEGS